MAYSYRAILLQNNRLQATEFVWKIHFSAHYCWTMLNKHGQVKTIQHSFKQANTHKSNLTYNFLPFIIYTMIRIGSSVSNSNFSFSFYMVLIYIYVIQFRLVIHPLLLDFSRNSSSCSYSCIRIKQSRLLVLRLSLEFDNRIQIY